MAKHKKGKKRKISTKTAKRKQQQKLQDFAENGLKHKNLAYVDPLLQKQAGVHGRARNNAKSNRRKQRSKLKKSIQEGNYQQ